MTLANTARVVLEAEMDNIKLKSDHQWTQLVVDWNMLPNPRVSLTYGTIHSNGQYERAIATRHYYITPNDQVTFYIQGHP